MSPEQLFYYFFSETPCPLTVWPTLPAHPISCSSLLGMLPFAENITLPVSRKYRRAAFTLHSGLTLTVCYINSQNKSANKHSVHHHPRVFHTQSRKNQKA